MQLKQIQTYHMTLFDPGKWGQLCKWTAVKIFCVSEKVVSSECVCIRGRAFILFYLFENNFNQVYEVE